MSHKIVHISLNKRWLFGALFLLLFCLTACPATLPIEITNITVKPAPLIGQVANVRFEFMSTEDEPDTTLEIVLQDGVKLVSGDLIWQGSLTANQIESHEISICTQFEGVWRIQGVLWSDLATGGSYEVAESVFLEVSDNTARVLNAYEYSDVAKGLPDPLTPLPELTSPICP